MRRRNHEQGLDLWVTDGVRSLWSYRTDRWFFDHIAADDFLAPYAEVLQPGDIILVDCPGFIEISRPFGRFPDYIHRPGGGLLQVIAVDGAAGRVSVGILAQGLDRFPSLGLRDISGDDPVCVGGHVLVGAPGVSGAQRIGP